MFAGLSHQETRKAYDRLSDAVAGLRRLSGGGKISLCELANNRLPENLRLQFSDLPWLDAWAENLGPPGQLDIGFVAGLFLLRASERNRRFASPGEVWAEAFCGYPANTRLVLMLNASAPSHALADALRSILRAWDLRNALDHGKVQFWYRTIMVQFGIPRASFEKIPFWLGPSVDQAEEHGSMIVRLLKGGSLASPSFLKFIGILKRYRRKEIQHYQAATLLASSPWVVPDLVDEVLKNTTLRPDIRVASDDDDNRHFDGFIDKMRLRWNDSVPEFITRLLEVPGDDALIANWTIPTIDIWVGKQRLGRMSRNRDGSYSPGTDEKITIQQPKSSMVVQLLTTTHLVLGSIPVELFDDDEPVAWFLPGQVTATYHNGPAPKRVQSMVIRTPDGWTVPGADDHRSDFCGSIYWRIIQNAQCLAVLDPDGAAYWQVVRGSLVEVPTNVRLALLNPLGHGYIDSLNLGDKFRPDLEGWDNYTQVIRACWPPNSTGTLNPGGVMAVSIELLRTRIKLTCTIQGKHGPQKMAMRPTANPALYLFGVLRNTDEWEEVDANIPMNTHVIARSPYHIAAGSPIFPVEKSIKTQLLEGSRQHGCLLGRKNILPRLDGLGERVMAVQDDSSVVLHETIYHGGIVSHSTVENDSISIVLLQPMEELDHQKHTMIAWNQAGGLRIYSVVQIEKSSDHMSLRISIPDFGPTGCVGLAFDGVSLGWAPVGQLTDLMKVIAQTLQTANPVPFLELATFCRWLPLPVLMETGDIRARMVHGSCHNGLALLKAWLSDTGLPAGLAYTQDSMAFRRRWDVTSRLLGNWHPTLNEAIEVSDLLFPEISQIQNPENWAPLLKWNPAIVAFLMDAMRLCGNQQSRKVWACSFLASLVGIEEDEPPVCNDIRQWRDSIQMAPLSCFIQ